MIEILSVYPTSSDKYNILIDSNINFSQLKQFTLNKQVLIVTNNTVEKLYLDECISKIRGFSSLIKTCVLDDGEIYKSQESLNLIIDSLLINKFTRSSTVLIALGGGVIGDITGFAASVYQRGVDFIQVPTTLLSQVDSSVGGKTAINHMLGKNMIGSFYQPKVVYTSPEFYKTLPQREFISGMAEVVKYACMSNSFCIWLLRNSDNIKLKNPKYLIEMIKLSCQIKADIVAQDEKEISGKRAILNFGHTFAHAIEKCQKYAGLKHGEAVGVGILMALNMSYDLGLISKGDVSYYTDLLKVFNIPTELPKDIEKQVFYDAMLLDKKNSNSQIKFILMNGNSNLVIKSVDSEFLLKFLDKYF